MPSGSTKNSGLGYSVVAYAVSFPPFTGAYAAPFPHDHPSVQPVWPTGPSLEVRIADLERRLAETEGKNKAYREVIQALLAELRGENG